MDNNEKPKVLMIAYHYPPARYSSGKQRSLAFSNYLRANGWQPIVLTVKPMAYEMSGDDQLADIPADIIVKRVFALDASKHLSICGRYPLIFALPDNWSSWWLAGVCQGLRLIKRYRPAVIWSTYPFATAHLIGWTLCRLTQLPWIADCRDAMTEPGYPEFKARRRVIATIERKMIKHATKVVFTTSGLLEMYSERYPEVPAERWSVITNGYDPGPFASVRSPNRLSAPERRIVLVHSGIIYPNERRNPAKFFHALSKLKKAGVVSADSLHIILRAVHAVAFNQALIDRYAVNDLVSIKPSIPYREALQEMVQADGLLVFQGTRCNHQIPAKVYEYFRAQRPILGLTNPQGNTAAVLREAGIDNIASLDSCTQIVHELSRFIESLRAGTAPVANEASVRKYNRSDGARQLAQLLNAVAVRA